MDERALADNLDRFLDELASGPAGDRPTLDPELTEIARRYRAVGRMPAPEDVRDRVRKRLDEQANVEEGSLEIGPISPNGVTSSSRWNGGAPGNSQARAERRWGFSQLAIAAVLLLAGLGIGYFVFGPGFGDDKPRTTIPAAVGPAATPSPAPYTEETVLSLTLPTDALPKGDGISAGLALITIPPGTQSRWFPTCCNGPLIEYIISGNYTVRAEDPIRIVRSGGAVEEIPAGVEVTLGPGDSLISRNETAVEAANTGDVPVEMLGWVLIEEGAFNGHSLPGWIMSTVDVQFDLPVSPSPATVRLLRIELDGESTYPAAPPGTLAFAIALPTDGKGTPTPTMTSKLQSGEVVNTGKSANVVYLLTMEQAVAGESSPVTGSPTP